MKKQEEWLLELKEEIDNAKSEITRLEGQKSYLLDQLKEEFEINSLKEANKKVEEEETSLEELEEQLDEQIQEIKEKYEADD